MSGAATREAGAGVRRKSVNLSTRRPEVLPQPTAFAASSTVGMLMTHSLVAFRMPKVWLRLLITQPTVGGSNPIIVCHDMAIMFARPLWAVGTSTTGPGLGSRQNSGKGKVL